MIDIGSLTDASRGAWVVYRKGPRVNRGRILRWSDRYIYVVFWSNENWDDYASYTAAATLPEDLSFE